MECLLQEVSLLFISTSSWHRLLSSLDTLRIISCSLYNYVYRCDNGHVGQPEDEAVDH